MDREFRDRGDLKIMGGKFSVNSLSGRLDRIRNGNQSKKAIPGNPVNSVRLSPPWKYVKPFVSVKKTVIKLSEIEKLKIEKLNSLFSCTINHRLEDLLFYDLETTGLSGGAGTVAFLAGFGQIQDDDFLITQLFLHDFPGENDFLGQIKALLTDEKIMVSYNGKSFDHPLLRTRFLMNGLKLPLIPEIDLLHTVRRLWKNRLPSCRLGIIENEILNIHRKGDIPGIEIPDIYFNYLRKSRKMIDPEIYGVFNHHLQDIKSLAVLLAYIESLWNDPGSVSEKERTSLGKLMLHRGRKDGLELLEKSWRSGDYEAGKIVSMSCKRNGNLKKAVYIWEEMWNGKPEIFQGIELAKYYEHKVKNIENALDIVSILLSGKSAGENQRLQNLLVYRLERLKRKKRLRSNILHIQKPFIDR